MLKKLICCVIMCLILIGCSSPEKRLEKAKSVCEECSILFRTYENYDDVFEDFILQDVRDQKRLYYIKITDGGRISTVKQIILK